MRKLEQLPDALLLTISGKLDLRSLCALGCSCRTMNDSLSQFLLQLPVLHVLDTALPAKALKRYLEGNSTIKELALDCAMLHQEDGTLLLKPHLKKLHLKNCADLTKHPQFFSDIRHYAPALRYLSLDLFQPDEQEDFESIALEFRKTLCDLQCLNFLSLKGQGKMFDGQVFRILSTACPPSLRALRIININEGDIRRLFDLSFIPSTDHLTPDIHVTGYSSLQKISLVLDTITDTLMCVLTSTLVNLTELDLLDDPVVPPQADLSNWGIQQIANCQNLKVLSLIRGRSKSWGRGQSSSFRRVNDLGLLLMAESCKDLEIVRLGGFSQVTDTGLHCILENYPHLRVFELIGMKQTSDLTFHDMVATSCSLVVVSLPAANQITSDAVVQLASCSQLKLLNLAFCRSVGDRGLKALSYLSKLSLLDLSGADITDFGLISLSKSSMPLVSLSLRSCKRLTHNGITALTRGSLPYTLQELDFSNLPCITDLSVMAFIESGMQLIDLRLRDCYAISDECVAALASMNYAGKDHGGSLRVLDLSNNIGVSRKILNLFQKPYFARLEWLGLPKHLKSEVMATRLHDQRPRVHFSFTTNPDKEFSYDTLSSKHRDHWGVEIGVGLSFHQRCDLCALMQG